MSNITDFRLSLIAFVPDAPEVVIQQATQYAARKLMRDTFVAEDESVALSQACVQEYLLNTPDCRIVHRVHKVVVDNRERHFEMDGPNLAVRILESMVAGKEIRISYSWVPARNDCEVPDYLFDMFEDAVRYAALAYIHLMPQQEWSSAERVKYFENLYDMEQSKIRTRVLRKFSPRTLMMKAPRFATGQRSVYGARRTGGRGWQL